MTCYYYTVLTISRDDACILGSVFDEVIKCHWFLDAAMQLGCACAS